MARAMAPRFCMPPLSSDGHAIGHTAQADSLEFHQRDQANRFGRQLGEFFQRQSDVFEQRHRTEQARRFDTSRRTFAESSAAASPEAAAISWPSMKILPAAGL